MADAWTELVGGSTLPVAPGNDAWDHLLAQGGEGGGTGENIYILQNIVVDANVIEEDIDVSAAVVNTTVPTGTDIEVDVEVQRIRPAIELTIDIIDIDNPEDIEV